MFPAIGERAQTSWMMLPPQPERLNIRSDAIPASQNPPPALFSALPALQALPPAFGKRPPCVREPQNAILTPVRPGPEAPATCESPNVSSHILPSSITA